MPQRRRGGDDCQYPDRRRRGRHRRVVPPAFPPRGAQGLYALHFAESAEEALQMLADGIRPQLIVILSDINIPGMDGLSLLREVKKSRPEMPVMMVTAYGE
ncbi:MAG: response regulator [Alphaproteobacteria bacterium]|nr:MAG: response regulator [Alphaproteobacteria bacterium]